MLANATVFAAPVTAFSSPFMPTARGGGRVGSHDQSIFMHQPPALSRILHLRYVHGFLHRHGNLAFFSGPQQLASHPKSSLSSPCQDPEETSRHRVEARQAQSAQRGPIVHATTRGPSTGYDFDSHVHTPMGAVDCSILLLAWLCIHAHSFLSVIQICFTLIILFEEHLPS